MPGIQETVIAIMILVAAIGALVERFAPGHVDDEPGEEQSGSRD